MSKIALMTLLSREESNLSPHFGKAKWILVHDTEQATSRFVQNKGLNGMSVVQHLMNEGCGDVICSEIGEGAVKHLHEANIRGWLGPADVPAPRLLQMLAEGTLRPVHATKEIGTGCCGGQAQAREMRSGVGCGCSH